MKIYLFILFLFSGTANAIILIEPFGGYNFDLSSNFNYVLVGETVTSSSDGGSGLEYGGRLGYNVRRFFIAVDYSVSSFDFDENDSTINGSTASDQSKHTSAFDETKLGIAVGYKLPLLFRIHFRYFLSAVWEGTDRLVNFPNDIPVKASGDGYAIGLGTTYLPVINIFLEYQKLEIDFLDRATQAGDNFRPHLTMYERSITRLMFGVSIPITF